MCQGKHPWKMRSIDELVDLRDETDTMNNTTETAAGFIAHTVHVNLFST